MANAISEGLSGLVKTGDPVKKEIGNQEMQDWNNYTSWLEKKGLKGSPALDKSDLGGKMIDLYRKENPDTTVSREIVPAIQQGFSKYRDNAINDLRTHKAQMNDDPKDPNKGRWVDPKENLDNFMKDLSIVDGIPGQKTTSHVFPKSYMQTFMNGKLIKKEDKGLAPIK